MRFDCGICQTTDEPGNERGGCNITRLNPALTPNTHDLAGIYIRRRTADAGQRSELTRLSMPWERASSGGMISATVLAIFFVPVFFVMITRCIEQRRKGKTPRAILNSTRLVRALPERQDEFYAALRGSMSPRFGLACLTRPAVWSSSIILASR